MHTIIIGAGPVGDSLVSLAQQAKFDVIMVEADAERANACADNHDVRVLNMDVADDALAEEAGFGKARAVIATTTDDSTNLMAMFLGREHGVEVLTSTVNHESHRAMFEHLGVHVLADPEVLVAQHLLDLTLLPRATDVTTLQDKEQIIEVTLDGCSPLAGHSIAQIDERRLLDPYLFIVSVEREEEEPFFPTERTELRAGDRLIVFSRKSIRREDLNVFTGSDED